MEEKVKAIADELPDGADVCPIPEAQPDDKGQPTAEKSADVGSKEKKQFNARTALKSDILSLLLKIIFAVALGWAVFSFVFGMAPVQGEAMYPRLRDGDLTVFYRLDKEYDIGDVITYRVNGKRYYGRVIARGGDFVSYSQDGQLLVNGAIQVEETWYSSFLPDGAKAHPLVVPEGGVYVLGDFRTNAERADSRVFGALDSATQTDGTVISLLRRRGL